MRSTAEFNGVRVLGGKQGTRRIGKVLRAVFFPDDFRLAGYIVKRPDFLFMFKRSDRFLALDRLKVDEKRIVAVDQKDSWDEKACQRIGLDWENALILQGMTVVDSTGEKVGTIDAVEYDPATGATLNLLIITSLGAKALVGQRRVPLSDISRYQDMQLFMRKGTQVPSTEGGLATVAGKQAAVVGSVVRNTTASANAAVGDLVEKAGDGAEKLGYQTGRAIGNVKRRVASQSSADEAESTKEVDGSEIEQQESNSRGLVESSANALGKQLGKSKGMFKAFSDSYKKASKG